MASTGLWTGENIARNQDIFSQNRGIFSMYLAQQFEIIKEIASKKIATAGGRFSLAQLDRLLGITSGKSRHWDKGQRPSADDLELLARKLDLSPRWLLLREGEPEGETPTPANTGETTAQRLETIERYMLKYNAPAEEVRAAFLAALGVNAKADSGSADQDIPHAEFDQAGNGRQGGAGVRPLGSMAFGSGAQDGRGRYEPVLTVTDENTLRLSQLFTRAAPAGAARNKPLRYCEVTQLH